MYAVEFETKIENGIVNIPKEYSDIYQSQARVLVLVDEVVKKTEEKKDYAAFLMSYAIGILRFRPRLILTG